MWGEGPDKPTKQESITAWNTRADGWISIEDRLPEDDGNVLTISDDGFQCIAWVTDNKKWNMFIPFDRDYFINVTHWQPLPDPPDTGKEVVISNENGINGAHLPC